MSIQKTPRVIFVDGFNTVGKDYFIADLKARLNVPVQVTDPRIWLPAFQGSKRYWDFIYRGADENNQILTAHLQHLRRLRELIDTAMLIDTVFICNRSFVSALNYNFIPKEYNGRNIGGSDEERHNFLAFYQAILRTSFSDVSTLMVNLNRFHPPEHINTRPSNIREMRKRMHARKPDVLMNDFYLDYLIHEYQNPSEEVRSMYTGWEDITSSEAGFIVEKYFTPKC